MNKQLIKCIKLNSLLLALTLLVFQHTNAQLPTYLPTNGLVAWYPFNGNANDESGNGNDGQAQGAILTSDRFGNSNKAYSFNGNLDNITTSLQQTNISSYTVSAWFKTNHGGWILTGRQVDSGDHSIRMLVNIDGVTAGGYGVLYGTDGDGNTDNTTTVANYNDNQWHHAVGVWDGSNSSVVSQFQMKLYIDGTLVPQTPGTSVGNGGYGGHPNIPISGNSVCRFGISPGNYAPQSLIGQLDDIAIYNRALTQSEVTALYTATATNTGGGTTFTTTAPPGIPYQAEVRNESGEVLANANVNIRFTLHELAANGAVSYQETHTLTTNELGLFAATIGAGTAVQGTFASINWAQTTKFLQVEVDTGNGYITMGCQQLMSVPYALYAANGPAGPIGPQGPAGPPGMEGTPGTAGVGVSNISLLNGNLEFQLTNGTSIPVGTISAPSNSPINSASTNNPIANYTSFSGTELPNYLNYYGDCSLGNHICLNNELLSNNSNYCNLIIPTGVTAKINPAITTFIYVSDTLFLDGIINGSGTNASVITDNMGANHLGATGSGFYHQTCCSGPYPGSSGSSFSFTANTQPSTYYYTAGGTLSINGPSYNGGSTWGGSGSSMAPLLLSKVIHFGLDISGGNGAGINVCCGCGANGGQGAGGLYIIARVAKLNGSIILNGGNGTCSNPATSPCAGGNYSCSGGGGGGSCVLRSTSVTQNNFQFIASGGLTSNPQVKAGNGCMIVFP